MIHMRRRGQCGGLGMYRRPWELCYPSHSFSGGLQNDEAPCTCSYAGEVRYSIIVSRS